MKSYFVVNVAPGLSKWQIIRFAQNAVCQIQMRRYSVENVEQSCPMQTEV